MFELDEVTQAPLMSANAIKKIVLNAWGLTRCNVTALNGYEDMNYRLSDCEWEDGRDEDKVVIFKVTNPVAARNTPHLDFQRLVCQTLNKNGVPAPFFIPQKDSNKVWRSEKIQDDAQLPVRLIRVIPGVNLEHFAIDHRIGVKVGELIAKFHNIMDMIPRKDWQQHIPFIAAENVQSASSEVEVLLAQNLIDDEKARRIRLVFHELQNMLEQSDQMDTGLIHSDINDTNILVEPAGDDGDLNITALIDMGDVHCSLRIMDIGATCLYLALCDRSDPDRWPDYVSWVLEGYTKERPCPDAHLIVSAMRCRMACSLVCGLRAFRINYRNEVDSYVLRTQVKGWQMLETLMKADPAALL